LVHLTLTLPYHTFHLFTLYRRPPSAKNRLKDSTFIDEFPELLAYSNSLKGAYLLVGDFNFHFDVPSNTYTAKLIDILDSFGLVQPVRVPTHRHGHTLDWRVHRADQTILDSWSVDHTLPSDHSCLKCSLRLSRPPPRQVYVEARKLADVDMDVFDNDLSDRLAACPPTSVDDLNQLLVDLLDTHAPATKRRVTQRPSSPWYSDVGPQLLEAKRVRRRAYGLTVHKQIFQVANKAVNTFTPEYLLGREAAKSAMQEKVTLPVSSFFCHFLLESNIIHNFPA
jgi:hypothetical protein